MVRVNGVLAEVSANGTFTVTFPLASGSNLLALESTDSSGNTARLSVNVTFSDPVPELEARIAALDALATTLDEYLQLTERSAANSSRDASSARALLEDARIEVAYLSAALVSSRVEVQESSAALSQALLDLNGAEGRLEEARLRLNETNGRIASAEEALKQAEVTLSDLENRLSEAERWLNESRAEAGNARAAEADARAGLARAEAKVQLALVGFMGACVFGAFCAVLAVRASRGATRRK